MFKFKVKTLPVEMTGVKFKDIYGNNIESWEQVGDLFEEVINEDSPFTPDFGVQGYYQGNSVVGPTFQIVPGGPHILYITGRPKSEKIPPEHRKFFRIPGAKYVYFWEDSKFGYLTQVLTENTTTNEN